MENIRTKLAQRPPMKLNLNRATYHQLINLPGIGDVVAARIILYRQNHGEFKTVDELPGIVDRSQGWLDNIRHRLEV